MTIAYQIVGWHRAAHDGTIGADPRESMVSCVAMSAADTFDSADYVFAATRDGLMARIEPVTVDANIVIDLGSATGSAARLLEKRFKGARVVSVDLSLPMLNKAQSKKKWLAKTAYVQADASALPFADESVDAVFSNQLLPWIPQPDAVFAEIARVLRKDGLFLFSTLGPDSLQGLRHEPFADMHDVGDALVRAGLRDPVLDVDRLTVTFETAESMRADFAAIGAARCLPEEPEILSAELELVYGHCWGGGPRPTAGEYRVDAGQIGRRSG